LRTTRSDNDKFIPSADAVGTNGATQVALTFDDNRLASLLFGQYGQHLALVERRLGVVAEQRGNQLTIAGSRDGCEQARRVLTGLYERLKGGDELVSGDVEGAIRLAIAQGSLFDYDPATARPSFEQINCASGRSGHAHPRRMPICARCGIMSSCSAPARHTGKTWLAVAHAVRLFERKEVDRIVLSRPAVEAGEAARISPRRHAGEGRSVSAPIYDALYDLMDARIVERAMQTGEIDRPARLHARPHACERRGDPRRGAEHLLDADEDVFDAARREQPHDRHRRSEPGGPAQRPDVRPCRGDAWMLDGVDGIGRVVFTAQDVIRHSDSCSASFEAYDSLPLPRQQRGGMTSPSDRRRRKSGR
jgi:phosphate starvation-inducible PhoH-like protein